MNRLNTGDTRAGRAAIANRIRDQAIVQTRDWSIHGGPGILGMAMPQLIEPANLFLRDLVTKEQDVPAMALRALEVRKLLRDDRLARDSAYGLNAPGYTDRWKADSNFLSEQIASLKQLVQMGERQAKALERIEQQGKSGPSPAPASQADVGRHRER